jgi:hypothetical protein
VLHYDSYKNGLIRVSFFLRVRSIAKCDYSLLQICPSVDQSVRPSIGLSVVPSVFLSLRPHGISQLPMDGFLRHRIFENFSKFCRENSSFTKI